MQFSFYQFHFKLAKKNQTLFLLITSNRLCEVKQMCLLQCKPCQGSFNIRMYVCMPPKGHKHNYRATLHVVPCQLWGLATNKLFMCTWRSGIAKEKVAFIWLCIMPHCVLGIAFYCICFKPCSSIAA